jgi:hypothetical protein
MTSTDRVTLAIMARVPAAGVVAFQAYEDRVLPVLVEYGGDLQRRMRNNDGTVELHILAFPSAEHLARFRADPRRAEAAPLLAGSGASTELFHLDDVI